ncbi:hypothetical protein L1987_19536 [Smallanthus sonchifolius]|uniref:Uncharacterized protein n=1 Tax=Smallanthus sonchifolius TaxID=185202 RepID=A0ACB9IPC3_9ASTR|nr:hypothetical protein L1987_19536 [Smallanthus sonchifolius]
MVFSYSNPRVAIAHSFKNFDQSASIKAHFHLIRSHLQMGGRGVISDKWSMRVLWITAIGSAIGLYMVAVERQTQNREKMLAEALRAAETDANNS